VAISSIRIAVSYQAAAAAARWRGAPLRRQTWRLEIVRRPLPRDVPALLPRRISDLLRLAAPTRPTAGFRGVAGTEVKMLCSERA